MLIATVAIGGTLLYYALSVFNAFQWWFSSGAAPTGWVGGFVAVVTTLVFLIGFVLIMRMPDDDESNRGNKEGPPS